MIDGLPDLTLQLIFADWLEEHGDPRGSFLRLGCELARLPAPDTRRADLEHQRQRLREEHPEVVPAFERAFALRRIQKKIGLLRDADPECLAFGARSHRYQFGPRLTARELAAFERAQRVRLPEEYRTFLLCMGNGGAGPGYGLFSLAGARRSTPSTLHEPFPLSAKDAADAVAGLRAQQREPVILLTPPLVGCLEIGHQGCAIMEVLVLSGEQRGTMWNAREDWYPYADKDGVQCGFFAWYERWLDQCLAPEAIDRWRKQVES